MTTVHDMKKIALIMTVGLCEAIERNAIPIHEAQHYLFSPGTMNVFENDPELREIIHIATEFDDLKRLVPKALGPAIADAKRRALEALKKMPACDFHQPSWLHKLLPIDGSLDG
jgi:hypothetical protein